MRIPCKMDSFSQSICILLSLSFFSYAVDLPQPATPSSSVSEITILSPADPIIDRGLLLVAQQQYEAAILEFSKVAQEYPTDPRKEESLFQIAECYRFLDRNSDALNAYLYLEKNNPKTLYLPQIQIQVGLLYGKSEKYKEAIPYLQKSLVNPPTEIRPLLQYALGLALLKNQQPDEAIPLLKALLQTAPPSILSPLASWALADHFEKLGNPAEALAYWTQTIPLTSDNDLKAQASARAGWILLQQEKKRRRLRFLKKQGNGTNQEIGEKWRTPDFSKLSINNKNTRRSPSFIKPKDKVS